MTVLKNPRYERFAQELAKGTCADKAYQLAGFKPNRGNASTLKQNQSILNRVAEILSEREQIHAQATAEAVQRAGLTKEWVIDRLVENIERGLQAIPVKDTRGIPTGEFKYEGSVVNRGLELLGKELGMFVDRTEDVTKRRNIEQIDTRIRQILGGAGEAGASEPLGGAGAGDPGDQALPTVPGHGTA